MGTRKKRYINLICPSVAFLYLNACPSYLEKDIVEIGGEIGQRLFELRLIGRTNYVKNEIIHTIEDFCDNYNRNITTESYLMKDNVVFAVTETKLEEEETMFTRSDTTILEIDASIENDTRVKELLIILSDHIFEEKVQEEIENLSGTVIFRILHCFATLAVIKKNTPLLVLRPEDF